MCINSSPKGANAAEGCICGYAFTIFLLRRHEVHTRMRLLGPLSVVRRAFTGRRFTCQRRLVTLCAWLILLPDRGPLPHTSHTRAMNAWLQISSG